MNDAAAFIRRAQPDFADAIVSNVIIYNAAIRGLLHQRAFKSLVSDWASSTGRHSIPFGRSGATHSCQMCSPTAVLSSACATGKQHQQV